jgi:hypothetical protein
MPWYSERLTPMGRWSPQVTPDRPTERTGEGRIVALRRVRAMAPDEAHLSCGALKAREDAREHAAWERASGEIESDGFVTVVGLRPRAMATGVGE